MDLTEGGIRVPYVVRWPRVVAAGGVSAQLAITMDWVPTFFQAAGVQPHPDHPLDGTSLLPVLRDPGACFDRALCWRMKYRNQRAMREGRWKYLAVDAHEYLFDLGADERERANLGRRDASRLAAMRERYAAWNAQMPRAPDDASYELVYTQKDMP
jgi:arylsulfatase A-like enzyme